MSTLTKVSNNGASPVVLTCLAGLKIPRAHLGWGGGSWRTLALLCSQRNIKSHHQTTNASPTWDAKSSPVLPTRNRPLIMYSAYGDGEENGAHAPLTPPVGSRPQRQDQRAAEGTPLPAWTLALPPARSVSFGRIRRGSDGRTQPSNGVWLRVTAQD